METIEGSDFEQVTSKTADNENTSSDSGIQISQNDGENDEKNYKTEDNNAAEKLESATRIEDNNFDEKLECTVTVEDTDADEGLECTSETDGNNANEKIEVANKTEDNNEDDKIEHAIKIEDNNEDDKIEHAIKTEDNYPELKSESTTKAEPTNDDIAAILSVRENFPRAGSPKENISVSKESVHVITDRTGDREDLETAIEQSLPTDNINRITVGLVQHDEGRSSPEIVVEPKIADRLPSAKCTTQIIRVVTPVNGTIPVQLRPLPKPSQISKKRTCFKTFTQCLLFTMFTMIVAGYAVGGAYLFSHLERQRDIEHNAKIEKWKNDTAILLATELRQVKPHEAIWARKVFHYLEVYERDLLKASALGYRRQDHKERDQRWTLTSSLFFSVSLMTTSGYGPLTPRSNMGRVAALFYSLLGIPLLFFWLMAIGYILATLWLALFQNLCCHLCREKTVNNQTEVLSKATPGKSAKLPKMRSNSIVPIEERKLLPQNKFQYKNSEKSSQNMFPEDLNNEIRRNDHLANKEANFRSKTHQIEFTEDEEEYYVLDYVVSTIYAFLFFVIYCIFSSALFSVYEQCLLTDVLYISVLMFLTLGPGCHELDDDGTEIKMKNNIYFTVHLCVGYCLLAMIVNLIYMMVRKKSEPVKLQKQLDFDTCFSEKF